MSSARRRTFPAFLLVGIVGFAVDAGVFLMARELAGDVLARALALLVAITVTWALNRSITFGSTDPRRLLEWMRYCATSAAGAVTNATVSLVILTSVRDVTALGALAAGSIAGLFVNFLLAKHLAFHVR